MMNDIIAKSFLSKLNPLIGVTILYYVDNIIDDIYELTFSKITPSKTGEVSIWPMKLHITEKKIHEVLNQK